MNDIFKSFEDFKEKNSQVFFHADLEKENMSINCWHGSFSIIDLSNALKRGKTVTSYVLSNPSKYDLNGCDISNAFFLKDITPSMLFAEFEKLPFVVDAWGYSKEIQWNEWAVRKNVKKGVDVETPFGDKTPTFVYNGIKIGDKVYKAWYSLGTLINDVEESITIYGRNYKDLPKIDGLTIQNDSDGMTDYFEEDRIRVRKDNKWWPQVYAAYVKAREHSNKIHNKKALAR